MQIPPLIVFAPNTIIRSAQMNSNFLNVRDTYNDHDIATTDVHGMGASVIMGTALVQNVSGKTFLDNLVFRSGTAFTGTFDHNNTANRVYTLPDVAGTFILSSTIAPIIAASGPVAPIGCIFEHYDFNGALTIDTNFFRYCDGSVVTISGIGPQTLPDLSGRYTVGYGTDGGGDIDTAPWDPTPVGNAGHQINIEHAHTSDPHAHTYSAHTHGPGTLQFQVGNYTNTGNHTLTFFDSGGSGRNVAVDVNNGTSGGGATTFIAQLPPASFSMWTATAGATGASDSGGGGTTSGASDSGMSNALSTTQSIQPRSIRVRYIMRIA
jgi:hypothetical protein